MTCVVVSGGNQTGKLRDFNELHRRLFTGKGSRPVASIALWIWSTQEI